MCLRRWVGQGRQAINRDSVGALIFCDVSRISLVEFRDAFPTFRIGSGGY